MSDPHLKHKNRQGLWWAFLRAHEVSKWSGILQGIETREKMGHPGARKNTPGRSQKGVADDKERDSWLLVDNFLCTIDHNPCEVRPGKFRRK